MFKPILASVGLSFMAIATAVANPVTVSVGAQAHDYFSLKGDYISTFASHDIEIINNSDSAKTFNYVYKYCAEGHNECAISYNNVTVNAHSRWNNHHDSVVSPKYDYVGKYNLTATTDVNEQNATSYGSVTVR